MTLPELYDLVIALGVRPPWWRPLARRRWNREMDALAMRYRTEALAAEAGCVSLFVRSLEVPMPHTGSPAKLN